MSCNVTVFLDGVEVDQSIYEHNEKGRDVGVVDGVWTDKHTLKKIVFAKAKTSGV